MSLRAAAALLSGVLTLTTGCSLKAPAVADAPAPAEGVVRTSRPLAGLSGVAMAPVGLLASNGSNLIADNGHGLISDKAAGYALLAAEALRPVAGAEVEVQDSAGAPVAGVAKVTTDAQGGFTLKQVPAGVNWIVSVKATGFRLTTIARASVAGPQPVTIDPATTAVTEHLRQSFGQESRALRQVRPEAFAQLAQALKARLDSGEVTIDLTPGGQPAQGVAAAAAHDGGLGAAAEAIVQTARADHAIAKAQGKDADDAAPIAESGPAQPPQGPGNKPDDKGPDHPGNGQSNAGGNGKANGNGKP